MSPNPLTREKEARREGAWWRVYAPALGCLGVMCIVNGYLAYLAYASTHPRPQGIIIIPSDWSLTSPDLSTPIGGSVPGGVYSDLLAAGVLDQGDYYYRYNDLDYRWVSKSNWTYSTQISANWTLLSHSRVALIFDGVDTASEVCINSHTVGITDNMFVRYVFDVKTQLEEGENTLDIKFESPVEYATRKYDIQAQDYPVLPRCVVEQYQGECHANHIRKMQASFSWDWGPAFPNLGIWKDWRLVGWDSLLITDVYFSAIPTSDLPSRPDPSFRPGWDITVKVWCDASMESGKIDGTLTLSLSDFFSSKKPITGTVENFETVLESNFTIVEDQVDLWWPNGYGEHPLYPLTVTWSDDAQVESSSKTVRVGFRTVELDQDYIDSLNISLGRHYRVKVNNVTMFMKGSNWIPAHVLPEKVTAEYTRYLLGVAANTHQNCMRVWGGGIYESDVFYETADELGILIWEDMMFACSMYPVDNSFLATVRAEVTTQVRRLQHHPSILLWAGNNENEAALKGNWYGTSSNYEQYKSDYVKLYVETIRPVTLQNDDTRPFVVSSPSNGLESEEEGYIAQNPYSNIYGDVHYYNYYMDAWKGEGYPRTRFASEYGFQSWPSFKTMSEVTIEGDWDSKSQMSYHRQHHPLGQEELALQVGLHMVLAQEDGSATSYHHYLYLTQIHQAMAVKMETEFYRRWQSSITEDGEGYTSGALYWQLNDIWQGASWASIEYGGRWKMLHYYSMDFFAPVITSLYMTGDNVKAYVVSDLIDDIEKATLTIEVHRYDEFEPKFVTTKEITVDGRTAKEAMNLNIWDDLHFDVHCQDGLYDVIDVCFVTSNLTLTDTATSHNVPDNFYLLGKPKDAPLVHALVKVDSVSGPVVSSNSNWTFTVRVTSDNVALFVWLETQYPGVFSQNGFIMTKPTVDLFFYAHKELTPEELQSSLTVTCLTDTYSSKDKDPNELIDMDFHPNDIRNVIYRIFNL